MAPAAGTAGAMGGQPTASVSRWARVVAGVLELSPVARGQDDLGHGVAAQSQLLCYLLRAQSLLVVQEGEPGLLAGPRLPGFVVAGLEASRARLRPGRARPAVRSRAARGREGARPAARAAPSMPGTGPVPAVGPVPAEALVPADGPVPAAALVPAGALVPCDRPLPGDASEVPNEPRRWSWYLPLANSALVSSSRSRYCSAALLTPTATMVRPFRFFSWHSGDIQ